MNKLPEKDNLHLKCVELATDFCVDVMKKAFNIKDRDTICCGLLIAYLELEYMDARRSCDELQEYLDNKQLSEYMDADYNHTTNFYEPQACVTLGFKKRYLEKIEEIITTYKLMEQNE